MPHTPIFGWSDAETALYSEFQEFFLSFASRQIYSTEILDCLAWKEYTLHTEWISCPTQATVALKSKGLLPISQLKSRLGGVDRHDRHEYHLVTIDKFQMKLISE